MAENLFSDEEKEEQDEIKGIVSELHLGDIIPIHFSDVNCPLKAKTKIKLMFCTKTCTEYPK